jgi:hypothetical protein
VRHLCGEGGVATYVSFFGLALKVDEVMQWMT